MVQNQRASILQVSGVDSTHNSHGVKHHDSFAAEDDPNFKSDIDKASIFGQLTFTYVFKLIKTAFKNRKQEDPIKDDDLVTFPYDRRCDSLEAAILMEYDLMKFKNPEKNPSLAWALVKAVKGMIFKCMIVAIIFSFIRIFTGWVLKKLIDSYEVNDSDESYKWSGILAPCLLVGFFFEHHYNHIGTYYPIHIRGALVSMIYNKVTKLSLYTLTKISTGQVINLASNDVNVFDEFGVYFPKLLVAPFVIVGCGALLWIYFGAFCLIGLGYICFWFPMQAIYFVRSEKEARERNATSDERVRLTSESIEGIRLLKMYAWEIRFKSGIFNLREKETDLLRKELVGESMWRGVSFSSLAVASFLIYMPFYLSGGKLTPGIVFSTYYLFAFIRLYGAFFVNQGLLFLIQVTMLLKKIEKLLDTHEIGEIVFEEPKDKENSIEFENFTGYWAKSEEEYATKIDIPTENETPAQKEGTFPTLIGINANIKKGSLNALVGPVGSGKTSLLMTLTGEMPRYTGKLRYRGTFAYVEQEPTIFAGTFRESICFGKPYEPEFYAKVIKACNLETDLQLFPKGDMSEIGEKGNNLSGGQKARLALARGVYADADIYLLDDPLSAVDPKVAASIFNNCISGILKGKTVILVTHQVDFAKSCQNIMMMDQGKVIGSGPFEAVKDHEDTSLESIDAPARKPIGTTIINVAPNEGYNAHPSAAKQELINPIRSTSAALMATTLQKHASEHFNVDQNGPHAASPKKAEPQSADPENATLKDQYPGHVGAQTYKKLISGMGNWFYLLSLSAFYIMVEMANIGYGVILGTWVDGHYGKVKSLAILGGLVGFTVIAFLAKYIILNIGLVRTSKKHHEKMLDRVIQAPVLFYDTNPIGQILNRFSNDTGTLDRFLSLISMDVLDNVLFILTMIITVSIIDPIHLAPLAAEVIYVIFAISICFNGVQQTKKFEINSKGPLFALFSSSLSGVVVIRSYGQGDTIKEKFKNQLHSSMKGSQGFALSTRFLAFYVDFGYNLAEIAVIFLMTARNTVGSNASLSGFSLALILSISGILQYTLRQACMANILIEAASRIQSYWDLPQEAALSLPADKQLQEEKWPQKGDISFNKVFMKYSPTGPHVIKNLTLHAEAGQRIGCVGRTGAGKTSILQLLFRLQEVDRAHEKEGCIHIDNKEISSMGLHQLRGNISIIPQMPFILSGTVRYNVDPLGKATDEEIWNTLENVRLRGHVERLPNQLDTLMTAQTSVFSVGQKQLVCLARSILKPAKIMIMDEATANMDQETDVYVTNKIRETFSTSTTFTIAHRLSTIANYDRVLVLDKGQIKEFDEPYKLLVKRIGDEDLTSEDGHFASMVKNTGPITSKFIFGIAFNAYKERHPNMNQPQHEN